MLQPRIEILTKKGLMNNGFNKNFNQTAGGNICGHVSRVHSRYRITNEYADGPDSRN
jgi:hypothetical protein